VSLPPLPRSCHLKESLSCADLFFFFCKPIRGVTRAKNTICIPYRGGANRLVWQTGDQPVGMLRFIVVPYSFYHLITRTSFYTTRWSVRRTSFVHGSRFENSRLVRSTRVQILPLAT